MPESRSRPRREDQILAPARGARERYASHAGLRASPQLGLEHKPTGGCIRVDRRAATQTVDAARRSEKPASSQATGPGHAAPVSGAVQHGLGQFL